MTKKVIALVLALLMVLSMAACQSEDESGKNGKNNDPLQNGEGYTGETTLSEEENTVSYLMINYAPSDTEDYYILVTNLRGETKAEISTDIHKVASIDSELLFEIEEEMVKAGIMDLEGLDTFEDGGAIASVYMEYTDGSQMMINFNGAIPDEFVAGYDHMVKYFTEMLKNAPDYVPEPKVDGEVDAQHLQLLKDILNKTGIKELDSFKISAVAKDENTAANLEMDSDEFVASASLCESKLIEVPYKLVVIKVSSQENIEAVRADLADGLNWNKWVIVTVDRALIAQKGDYVLCLMTFGDNYSASLQAITDCGWENIIEYKK